jgi:type I restriction enzyme S subunit
LDNKFDKLTKIKQLQEESISDTEKILSQKLHNIFEQGKIKNWKEEALGEICEIARGGSPRPIQHYLTNDVDAINWIKISDATDSTKYIYKTKQKITKEGLHKTRMVYPGDFILTNSMSFGRPYIMKTEGAIHDGWLLLRPKKELTEEYLYYFLSSDDIYSQFKKLAGGAVVQNLNSQLVKGVKILIPSLAEQKEIVKELDKLSEKIENLKQLQKSQLEDFKKLEKAYLKEAFNGESI